MVHFLLGSSVVLASSIPAKEMATHGEISLEDIADHCKVETSCLDEEVTSAFYHELSSYLSKWKLIAPKLKFTDTEIQSLDEDNAKAEMKRISFLETWKQKFAMKATYRALMESLLGIKRVEDARGVCQVLKDSQNVKGTHSHVGHSLNAPCIGIDGEK